MTTSSTFAIVGGGLAGAKAAEALRDKDFDGHIVLFAAEEHLPYERPPLSKEYLAGKKTLERLHRRSVAAWYRDHNVDLRLGTPVSAIDPGAHTVGLPDGSTLRYDKLLLATGSRPRRPPIPGADADGVHYLRTVDDADALNSPSGRGSSLAIVGGGWIGLEVAAGAGTRRERHRGRGRRAAAAGRARPRGAARCSPSCTASTAWTSGSARRRGDHHRRRRGDRPDASATGPPSTPTRCWSPSARRRTSSSPSGPGWPWATAACSSTRRCAPATPTSSPSATSPPPSIRCSERASAPSTGPTRSSSPPSPRQAMLGKPAEYDELPYFFTDQYDLGMEYVGHAPDYDGGVPRRRRQARVHRVLARRRQPGAGRDERQHLGGARRHQGADPVTCATGCRLIRQHMGMLLAVPIFAAGCADQPVINTGEPPSPPASSSATPSTPTSNARLVNAFDYVGHVGGIRATTSPRPAGSGGARFSRTPRPAVRPPAAGDPASA